MEDLARKTGLSRAPALRLGLTLLVLALAAGCSKCAGTKVSGPEEAIRYVPKSAEGAAVVPDLGVLGDRLKQLQGMKLASFAAQLQGFPSADAFVSSLVQQAGVDLRSRESMKKFGLAPERGLAIALLSGDSAYAVVGVGDAKAFAASMLKLAQTRLGAGTVNQSSVNGHDQVLFSRGTGKPLLGYVLVDGYALIAPGDTATKLSGFAGLAKENSLAEESQLKSSLARLPADRDLYVYAPQNVMAKLRPGLLGFTATASLTKDALHVRVDAPWPDTRQTLSVLEPKPGPALAWKLPEDAFAVARYSGDPESLASIWPMLAGPYLQRALAEAKLDVKQEILANLKPGIVASLSVSPEIPLGAGMPELDVRRTNPFRYAQLVALAQAVDPEKVPPLLARMPQLAPRFGATIESVQKDGATLYTTRYAQGEGVHFAEAKNGLVVFASPLARLEKMLTTLRGGSSSAGPQSVTDAQLKDVLEQNAFGAIIDLDRLRTSVRALPAEAWGIGGFAIKASAERWLAATDELRAITLGITRRDNAAQADLALRFTKK